MYPPIFLVFEYILQVSKANILSLDIYVRKHIFIFRIRNHTVYIMVFQDFKISLFLRIACQLSILLIFIFTKYWIRQSQIQSFYGSADNSKKI